MYPHTFLETLWRLVLRPQVFVAMSFAPQYASRYTDVIEPAIRGVLLDGQPLEPYRVDVSKSGDSILTDISDGIAHSRLVLADVSTAGRDSVTGAPFRNGNVMYEVGIALACRQPTEILLVRDDHDAFLFDVSAIPHVTLDFTDTQGAIAILTEHLVSRAREQRIVGDARVQMAIASLSAEETFFLRQCKDYAPSTVWGHEVKGIATWNALATSRLLDKGIIRLAGEFGEMMPAFTFTPLGYVVHQAVNRGLRKFKADAAPAEIEATPDASDPAQQALQPDKAPEDDGAV